MVEVEGGKDFSLKMLRGFESIEPGVTGML